MAFIAKLRRWKEWRGEVRAARGWRAGRSSVNGTEREQASGMGMVRHHHGGELASLA